LHGHSSHCIPDTEHDHGAEAGRHCAPAQRTAAEIVRIADPFSVLQIYIESKGV
jgi:hypothetical protein